MRPLSFFEFSSRFWWDEERITSDRSDMGTMAHLVTSHIHSTHSWNQSDKLKVKFEPKIGSKIKVGFHCLCFYLLICVTLYDQIGSWLHVTNIDKQFGKLNRRFYKSHKGSDLLTENYWICKRLKRQLLSFRSSWNDLSCRKYVVEFLTFTCT